MLRSPTIALMALVGCTTMPEQKLPAEQPGYAGTVEKVLRVVRQGDDLPGMQFFGRVGSILGPVLRHNVETLQYIVRTPTGQITAQSDEEFPVGDCVEVIPQTDRSGPAFRYGEAKVVKSERCNG
jgi:hypothetical protein